MGFLALWVIVWGFLQGKRKRQKAISWAKARGSIEASGIFCVVYIIVHEDMSAWDKRVVFFVDCCPWRDTRCSLGGGGRGTLEELERCEIAVVSDR